MDTIVDFSFIWMDLDDMRSQASGVRAAPIAVWTFKVLYSFGVRMSLTDVSPQPPLPIELFVADRTSVDGGLYVIDLLIESRTGRDS